MKQMQWIVIAGILLIGYSMMHESLPKESVAAVNGKPCAVDGDCPCWGLYNATRLGATGMTKENMTAYGLGVASCKNLKCDMTWCYDIQPAGAWLQAHPWQWMKDNTMMVFGIVALLVGLLLWPKQ